MTTPTPSSTLTGSTNQTATIGASTARPNVDIKALEKENNKLVLADLVKNYIIPESTIERFWYKLDKFLISIYQNLSIVFIENHFNDFYTNNLCQYQVLSSDFLLEKKDVLNWQLIGRFQTLSDSIIEQFYTQIGLPIVVQFQTLSTGFMLRHLDILPLDMLCVYQTLSMQIIDTCIDKWNWSSICRYQNLADAMIVKYHQNIDWDTYLTYHGKQMPENLINLFSAKVLKFLLNSTIQ